MAVVGAGRDCRISYLDLGQGSPLLLIHGGHGGWFHWIGNVEELARHRRVIAPDLPGFGRSDRPAQPVSLAVFANELIGLLDRLQIDAIDIAAFSFGACVAAYMAAHFPDRVLSVGMVNPAGMGPASPHLQAIQDRASAEAKRDGLEHGVRVTVREIMLSDPETATPELLGLFTHHVRAARVETRPIARTYPTMDLLGRSSCSLWLLLGENDPHQAHELEKRARDVGSLSASHTVSTWLGAHWLQFEMASRFNEAALRFTGRR